MLQSILDRLYFSFSHFGRVYEGERAAPLNPWEVPKRDKFYLTNQELKTIGLALTYYKKHLRKQKAFERLDQVSELDNRIFNFIAWLELKEGQQNAVSELADTR